MGQVWALIRGPFHGNNGVNDEVSQVQYPPKSHCFFGSYFIMGGESFNTANNAAYLFGDSNDLSFLNRRPAAFPYPAPAAREPSKTLQSLVNIRRDSVKLVKLDENSKEHTLEFILDSDVPCVIKVITNSKEDFISGTTVFPDAQTVSPEFSYPAGIEQHFTEPTLTFKPDAFNANMFKWSMNDNIPLIIHVDVVDNPLHSHTVLCMFEKTIDNTFSLKVLKQKQVIDGISFILQEIYGMESKANASKSEGNGECVVCLSAPRDTMILPCRHLCLCYTCAENVRFQSNGCLICRQPFRALLRIEALQKVETSEANSSDGDDRYERVNIVQYTDRDKTSIASNSTHNLSASVSQIEIPLAGGHQLPVNVTPSQQVYTIASSSLSSSSQPPVSMVTELPARAGTLADEEIRSTDRNFSQNANRLERSFSQTTESCGLPDSWVHDNDEDDDDTTEPKESDR